MHAAAAYGLCLRQVLQDLQCLQIDDDTEPGTKMAKVRHVHHLLRPALFLTGIHYHLTYPRLSASWEITSTQQHSTMTKVSGCIGRHADFHDISTFAASFQRLLRDRTSSDEKAAAYMHSFQQHDSPGCLPDHFSTVTLVCRMLLTTI